MRLKIISIFGGSGFLGTELTRRLLNNYDVQVIVLDKVEPNFDLISNSRVTFIKLDFSTYLNLDQSIIDIISNSDAVFFKIGLLGDPNKSANIEYATQYLNVNSISLLSVLDFCSKYKIKKVILDSSIAAVANVDFRYPITEDIISTNHLNLYAMSKAIMEDFGRYLYADLNIHIFRYPRVHSLNSKNVINYFIQNIREGQPIRIVGNKLKQLDFVHIDDVINANIRCLELDLNNTTFHISNGCFTTLEELAEIIIRKMGYDTYPKVYEENGIEPLEPIINCLDSMASFAKLKLEPARPLEYIIDEVIQYTKNGY